MRPIASPSGVDFRPAYRHLAFVRKALSRQRGCFTATATERVVEDIKVNLELQNPAIFRTSTRRDNLTYAVCGIRDAEAMLHQAVFSATGTGLVYVGTRYQAEKWASRLEGVHGGVEAYHAGLDADTGSTTQSMGQRGSAHHCLHECIRDGHRQTRCAMGVPCIRTRQLGILCSRGWASRPRRQGKRMRAFRSPRTVRSPLAAIEAIRPDAFAHQ